MKDNKASNYAEWVFRAVRDKSFSTLPLVLLSATARVDASRLPIVKEKISVLEQSVERAVGVPYALFADVWVRLNNQSLGSAVFFTKGKLRKKRFSAVEIQELGYKLIAQPYVEIIGFAFEESNVDLEAIFAGGSTA